MSKSINKIFLLGCVGQDPDVNNSGVVKFSLATNAGTKEKPTTDWHKIVCFGKLGEIVAKYVKKGAKVHTEGELHYNKYIDKTGAEKMSVEIIARDICLLGSSKKDEQTSDEIPF